MTSSSLWLVFIIFRTLFYKICNDNPNSDDDHHHMSYVLTIFYSFYFSEHVLPEELKTASGIKAVLLNTFGKRAKSKLIITGT